jgi:hypothetical protein
MSDCVACDEYNRVKTLLKAKLPQCVGNLSMLLSYAATDHLGQAMTELRALQSNLGEASRYLAQMLALKKEKLKHEQTNERPNS